MAEEKEPFRFLSDAEFLALDVIQKAAYLAAASAELESRQRTIREHMARLAGEVKKLRN